MTTFSDDFIYALDRWQNGWNEIQEIKQKLSEDLEKECKNLDDKYKTVILPCYRKRYIHRGELVDILLNNSRDEGITSWTTDFKFAEMFKGLYRESAVTAAIFECSPQPDEVILNVNELWKCDVFKKQIEQLTIEKPDVCSAIVNFRDYQSEIILKTSLRASDIIALTGKSSDFDDLCDFANIPHKDRPAYFRKLIKDGLRIAEPTYIDRAESRRAVNNTIKLFEAKLELLKNNN